MPDSKKISISKNGPFLVSGSVPLVMETIGVDGEGQSTAWISGETVKVEKEYALCRCGESKAKPFCDGTHAIIDFDGAETASREPVLEQAEIADGPAMRLADAESLCAFARFCDPNGRIWNQTERTDDPAVRAHFVRQAGDCASGRLIALDKKTGKAVEPELPRNIGIVEDPARDCSGPLWVRGGIPLFGADGKPYEVRNRVTLCRCGRSENKPFCNGAHASAPTFKDGLE